MFIKSIKLKNIHIFIIPIFLLIILLIISFAIVSNTLDSNITSEITSNVNSDYIEWVDFNVSYDALKQTSLLDIESHLNNLDIKYDWIELLAYLGCIYGGDFNKYSQKDLDNLIYELDSGKTIEELTSSMPLYYYYYEAYSAVLKEFIGLHTIQKQDENGNKYYEETYGLKAFSPISSNYSFTHYKDFGNSRSYGFSRTHLGNDLMGSIGTPIIAIESGIVENIGWNQYGGWRLGIRSFDGNRYYYYAHLRKDTPYVEGLEKGSEVQAGDVIGYLGMTGYSITENVNNVNVPHLHLGIQLIFDESQIDSPNEIWIDVYNIVEFLYRK